MESETFAQMKKRTCREKVQSWRLAQSQEVIENLRNRDSCARQLSRNRERQQDIQETDISEDIRVDAHSCGKMDIICQFCSSRNFLNERSVDKKFNSCCRKGKFMLPKHTDGQGIELSYPQYLRNLLKESHFRDNIRSYNNALSFASMGAKIVDIPGPYVFKIHGQTYHRTSHLSPSYNQIPKFAQLYVIDNKEATRVRLEHPANSQCRPDIMDNIDNFFRQHNRIADSYKTMRRFIETADNCQSNVSMIFRKDRQNDLRRYNTPLSNEVAMIFVNEDGEPPFERDIRVYPRNPIDPNQEFVNINILSPNLDPMCYPILFPYGQPGWQPYWNARPYDGVELNKTRKFVTMLQYKVALTAFRSEYNPVMSAGKLTQQWLVDSYLQVEANNLNFIRQNQQTLRAEQYQGLADYVAQYTTETNINAGVAVILPSSFEGSPRSMRERCNDAISIFTKFGAPDLFITFTANPNWPEIKENLRVGELITDRPDLIARVFNIKLKSLINDITQNKLFGEVLAYVYSIEFQKRGLPHAHILIALVEKFNTAERIDKFVCAEIPNKARLPKLYNIVTKCMIHGPCGDLNPASPCMENNKCSKKFPKEFNETTLIDVTGYPQYKRRSGVTAIVRGSKIDNRYVVPYNSFLLMKYDAHINVEVCTSIRAIKYIYKYIYKGYDCANMVITNESQNEILNYINARYVSAPEAMWRLLEHKMHDRSHVVIRLPVHLPNRQRIIFQPGHEQEALERAQSAMTKLESWFELNARNPDAHMYLYSEIPLQYVFIKGVWRKRKQRGDKVISRMYTVSPKDEERFYLRVLLLHVSGATSFENMRLYCGVLYATFKEAACARGLLCSDQEWDNCLNEAAAYKMPKQMRELLSFICCFCHPSHPLDLWNKYRLDFSLDYLRTSTELEAINLALIDIENILVQHSLTCASIGLPTPEYRTQEPELIYNSAFNERMATENITKFNSLQLQSFNNIVDAINNPHFPNRRFFIDGPGGTGKTFVYNTLVLYLNGKQQIVLSSATTGIAGTLLIEGKTAHSNFKLPVPLTECSVSSHRQNSKEAQYIRSSALIIIDEITMLSKHGLHCIDKLLRELMKQDIPFGGKVFLIGGDFRQTLPIVARGSRSEIIESCIKSSPLWPGFVKLKLIENMRSISQDQHNAWLLQVGEGSITPLVNTVNSIEIPQHMLLETNNLIEEIFGRNIHLLPIDDLIKRVILAPTNDKTLETNNKIINMLPSEPVIYYSADTIVAEDTNDIINYPVEFLNSQTPSGTPPHKLILKKNVIVMLLRNLNQKKGLCNGTRLYIKELHAHFIVAEIISSFNRGDIVYIPRIDLSPSDSSLPFILKRRQFPVTAAYTITINKSQGQSYDHVGIDLSEPVFAHGQLYVALSRCKYASNIKIYIKRDANNEASLNTTANVVFNEVFN